MKNSINCPNCGIEIDIDKILYKQVENRLKQEHIEKEKAFEKELDEKRRAYKAHLESLKAKEEALKEQEEKFNEALKRATQEQLLKERAKLHSELKEQLKKEQEASINLLKKELEIKSKEVAELNAAKAEIEILKKNQDEMLQKAKLDAQKEFNKKLLEEKQKLMDKLKNEAKKEANLEIELMKKELEEKSQKLAELHLAKAEVEKLKREQEELKAKAELELQERLNAKLNEEKLKLQSAIEDEIALKLKQKDEQIEQMKRSLDDAKRKAEQASQQIQGEALELTIEQWLKRKFPFDNIEEVKKGAFGADCIQRVHTRDMQNCGVICYESKNTKNWSDSWIDKLKQDMLKVNADIGVLVTSVYPKDMDRMGFVDGIWVCTLDEFKGSASLLRESLIRLHSVREREENRADKMSLLYSYMTGNEFQMQLKAIVDGFVTMQQELDREKRSLMATWKRRQKAIDGVLVNTTEMYGALQGIAGSTAIATIEALELPEELDE